MNNDAVQDSISHRSPVRPDGWPQKAIVGYANDGLDIYVQIIRSGQGLVKA